MDPVIEVLHNARDLHSWEKMFSILLQHHLHDIIDNYPHMASIQNAEGAVGVLARYVYPIGTVYVLAREAKEGVEHPVKPLLLTSVVI